MMDGRMGDVEHFVEKDVFDNKAWDIAGVERPADRDSVMSRIVVTEDVVALSRRPCQHRLSQTASEVPEIQRLEYIVQVVNLTFRGRYDFSPAAAFVMVCSLADLPRSNVLLVGVTRRRRSFFP